MSIKGDYESFIANKYHLDKGIQYKGESKDAFILVNKSGAKVFMPKSISKKFKINPNGNIMFNVETW